MALQFKPATKSQARLRLGLLGPAGSGKTYSALMIASALGSRIAVIDTEHGSASKYAGEVGIPSFDVLELDTFSPQTYIDALKAAEQADYDVCIVDSLSHAWMGKDGALEMVDKAAKRSGSGNSYTAWRDVTPVHNAMVEALLQSRCHLIVTLRVKMEYVLETNAQGKQVPRKVGLAPIQREGLEYTFDVVGDLDLDHTLIVTKTRCSALNQAIVSSPGLAFGEQLRAWLTDGAPMPERQPPPPPDHQNGAGVTKSSTPPGKKSYGLGAAEQALLAHIQTVAKEIVGTDGTMDAQREAGRVLYKECFGSRVWATVQALPLEALEVGLKKLLMKQVAAEGPGTENEDEDQDPAPGMASPDGIADVRQLAASLGASALMWGPGEEVTLEAYTELCDYLEQVVALRIEADAAGAGPALAGDLARWHAQGKRAPQETLETLKRNLAARAKGKGA